MEGYKCFSNGEKCVESNSCDSVKDTFYDINSTNLKKICNLFDLCEPYDKGCKTIIISTSIPSTIPTTLQTTISTSIPNLIPTTLPTTMYLQTSTSTIIITIPGTIPTSILTIAPKTILAPIPSTILTTSPQTISTPIPITIPAPTPTRIPASIPKTIPIQIPSTIPAPFPTTIPTPIPKTIPIQIPSTIPASIPKEIPTQIPSTILASMPKTIPSKITYPIPTIIPTQIPSTILASIPSTIPASIPKAILSTILASIPTTIPTLVPKTIPSTITAPIPTTITAQIPAAVPKTISPNTIIVINSTLIEQTELPRNEHTSVIILALSHFKAYPSNFSFFLYVTPIINTIYTKLIRFQAIIEYYTNMRILKETNGNCNLQLITDLKYQYSCIAYEDNKNIKSITILPDFIFVNQENIDIISISPFTQIFMNDLLSYDQRYNAIINSTIYLMDNSTYEIYNKLLCNITGKINGTQPKLKNKNLNLIVNLHSGQKFETELDCSIDNIGLENYLLNCKSNEILESNFKIAISFIDNNDILLINFINGTNSIIESNDTKNYKEQFFSK